MDTHIIFDLDGTLLNTIDDLADAGNHVCAAHGWPTHTVDEFKRMVGRGIPNLVRRFTPDGLGEEELAGALAEFSAYYADHKEDKTAPYPGVPALLDALKGAGIRLAVLSNKAHALAGPVVEHYFPGVFDCVQGALPDAPLKPDPTLLRALMDQMEAKPDTTLFVGDSDVDVLTGKNGGLTVCGVLWGFREREELKDAGADWIVHSPDQISAIATGTALLPAGQGALAAELLRMGRLAAVPTETVYGLAADATQESAVQAVYETKGRPERKPLSVLVDGMDMVERVCRDIPEDAYKLAGAFWPGPLTMILRGNGAPPPLVSAEGTPRGCAAPTIRTPWPSSGPWGGPWPAPPPTGPARPAPSPPGRCWASWPGRSTRCWTAGPAAWGWSPPSWT